jgi:hypothetical protein
VPANWVGGGMDELVTLVTAKRLRSRDPDRLKSEKPVSSSLPNWRS